MNCTDCTNTVPITDGANPKYVRPSVGIGTDHIRPRIEADPLCRICWEKAVEKRGEGERE